MSGAPLAFAMTAGMVATVNPCGFAMLPAYLALFVGSEQAAPERRGMAVARALVVSATLTTGFVTVFGGVGLLVTFVAEEIDQQLSKVTVVIGAVLVLLGIRLLRGKDIVVRLPHLEKGGRDGSLLSMYLYGVSYAVASLSCTLGPFLAAVSPTFRNEGIAAGLASYVVFALGMGAVVALLTGAVALARGAVVGRIRRLLPYVNRISGVLLLVAGAYTVWYGVWELRGSGEDPLIDGAQQIRNQLEDWVRMIPRPWAVAILVFGALGASLQRARTRRRAPRQHSPEDPSAAPASADQEGARA